jgi:hypothetical protein
VRSKMRRNRSEPQRVGCLPIRRLERARPTRKRTASWRASVRAIAAPRILLCRQAEGGGRVYQQTFIDTYAKVAFAKLYDRKTPITAADLVNDRVVPFVDEHAIKLCRDADRPRHRILRRAKSRVRALPGGREYRSQPHQNQEAHRRTVICEQFHRTVLDEFYRVAFRKKIYPAIDELQADSGRLARRLQRTVARAPMCCPSTK